MSDRPAAPAPRAANRELQSWKDVAGYLGVSVRRAQQWEKEVGLPISRLALGHRSRIFTTTEKLDAWRRARLVAASTVSPEPADEALRHSATAFSEPAGDVSGYPAPARSKPADGVLGRPAPASPEPAGGVSGPPTPGDVARADAPAAAQQPPSAPAPSSRAARPRVSLLAVAALALAAVAGTLAWTTWGSRPAPHTAGIVDGRLVVSDRAGRQLWSVEFPEGYARALPDYALGGPPESHGVRRSLSEIVADIDADGSVEVVFVLNTSEPQGPLQGNQVICYGEDGSERWRFKPGRPVRWQDRRFDENYVVCWVMAPFRANGVPLVAVGAQNLFFPFQVALLEARTGALAGEFWHPGGLTSALPTDLDDDGQPEIVAAGVNNPGPGPGLPALAVLRAPFPPPLRPGDDVFAGSASRAFRYLLFPPVDGLQEIPHSRAARWMQEIDGGLLRLRVTYGPEYPERGRLHYVLDRDLAVVDARPCDSMRAYLGDLHRSGQRRRPLTEDEIQTWRAARRFDTVPNANLPEVQAQWRPARPPQNSAQRGARPPRG